MCGNNWGNQFANVNVAVRLLLNYTVYILSTWLYHCFALSIIQKTVG